MKLWHTIKEVPHSSIVGGGAMLLAESGECVGIVHLLNVAPERRKEFEAAVFSALSAQGKDNGALDAFLNLIADGDFEEDVDADADDYGRLIDCTRYHIRSIPVSTFNDFCDAIGVKPKHKETYGDALIRLITESSTPSREG